MKAPTNAAIGFRVKSGWAVAVLVTGPAGTPRVADRCVVELSDPEVPETRQPYHDGFGTAQTNRKVIARLAKIIERCARRSIGALVERYAADGFRLRGAGVVVGSLIDPALITNDHIRAHAYEGRLFRTVVEQCAARARLRSRTLVEKELNAYAARALRRRADQLKRAIIDMGRALGGPWRAEEKSAALAAWIVLASSDRSRASARPSGARSHAAGVSPLAQRCAE